jgi:hypothetical protein
MSPLVWAKLRYLIKPVTPQDLVAAIRQAIALSEADRLQRVHALLEVELPET